MNELLREQRISEVKPKLNDPHYVHQKQTIELIKEWLDQKFDRVLDFGAGNSPYKEHLDFNQYITADVTQNKNNSIDFIINSEKPSLSFKENKVDLILSMDVFEHHFFVKNVLSEFNLNLKDNGKLLIRTPFLYRVHEHPHDYFRWTEFGIKRVLEESGFEVIKLAKIGNAWTTTFSLLNEKYADTASPPNFIFKIVLKIFRELFLPLINPFLARVSDPNIYSELLVLAGKKKP